MEEVLQEDEMELTVNIEASEEILEARDQEQSGRGGKGVRGGFCEE